MEHHTLTAWQDRAFALDWAGNDRIGEYLAAPRDLASVAVAEALPGVRTVLDIASGPGAFLAAFLRRFPEARGIWADGSEVMREQAQRELAEFGDRVSYRIVDMTRLAGADLPTGLDVVLSSRASHHLTPVQLAEFYASAAALLAPGGWLANLDHTRPVGQWQTLMPEVRARLLGPTTRNPGHHHSRPLPTLAEHLGALGLAGVADVELVWKSFQTVLLMGRAT